MKLVYKWMLGMKRIYIDVEFDQGNICNQICMEFKSQTLTKTRLAIHHFTTWYIF